MLDVIIAAFIEGKGGRKRGRETSVWKRNTDWLPLAQAGDLACTQARALMGNQTGDLPPCRTTPSQLNPAVYHVLTSALVSAGHLVDP